jgi:hypothetical protein
MGQTVALIWLKWKLFRRSVGSRKGLVTSAASVLGSMAAIIFSLVIATGLGVAAYYLSSPVATSLATELGGSLQTNSFFLFTLLATLYLLWATLPLTLGSVGQFDPGRLLLYPISLRKLFAIDFLSELSSLGSIFAVPAMLAVGVGAGLRNERLAASLAASLCAIVFGLALTKWTQAVVGALIRSRRTRGETLVALLGAVIALSGAFLGQLIGLISRHGEAFRGIRWTPPGAAAVAFTRGLHEGGAGDYWLALLTLAVYAVAVTALTYRTARRAALGAGGARSSSSPARTKPSASEERRAGWYLPFLSAPLSAIVEKELRYAMRNAQLRVLALMPLILLAFRIAPGVGGRGKRGGGSFLAGGNPFGAEFAPYGEGLIPAAWVLYVFMILSSIACNLFAYEEGGMRSLILAPVPRRLILLGKNMVTSLLALLFSTILVVVNELAFRDVSLRALLFIGLCFPVFAVVQALIGNLLSMHFPKRLQFGKRLNVSGIAGLLLLPVALLMGLAPLAAILAGYLARSLIVKYVTLLIVACAALALYPWLLERQGRTLARREIEILEAVSGQAED